jgi:threonine/homoserine/homoserine lactone efflux protein
MLFVPIMYLVMSTLSPGPVTILTIKNTTQHGRTAGTAVALGGTVTTAVFVVTALLLVSGNMVNVSLHTAKVYQQVGAIFILLMGIIAGYKSLFAKEKVSKAPASSNQITKSFFTGIGLMAPYFPQAILFYTVILPHHSSATNLNSTILLMGFIKIALTLGWYSSLATAAKSIQTWFFNSHIQRLVEFTAACFLIGISVTLLLG